MKDFDRDAYLEKCKELSKSKEFIDTTTKYADSLIAQNLPVIFDKDHLDRYFGLSINRLIYRMNTMYSSFSISKKKGGKRHILSPKEPLKGLQKWIAEKILQHVQPHKTATAFRKGGSIIRNASPHTGSECVLNVDLIKFFDFIGQKRVAGLFWSLGYTEEVSNTLACLCTVGPPGRHKESLMRVKPHPPRNVTVLPQGAPTSPHLANLVLRQLDTRFYGYAQKNNLHYTRYGDDITFSGEDASLPPVAFLVQVVKEEGFSINFKKFYRRKAHQRQIVTGLIINDGVKVQKLFKREVRKHLYFAKKFGVNGHLTHIGCHKKAYRDWLLGCILFVRSVEFDVGESMLVDFDSIDWSF